MKYQEQFEEFKRLVIRQGISRRDQLDQALPFGCFVPSGRIDRWFNGLLKRPTEFSTPRRYVNRFKLGADPEFIFSMAGARMDARQLKLQQGLAFGMDNNGRLTEIRPHPSRSAVDVVASILTALRWMTVIHPDTLQYDWLSGAFLCGDGLGGHVHFGRKRPDRNTEVKALDILEEELLAMRAYPQDQVLRRRQGDGHNQRYGLLGDIRPQMHGYEYRTFPSWLDSPELAFLTITLSKLVVLNPALTQGYIPLTSHDRHCQRIWNLLSYYKDIDDDARLALAMVSRRFPVHIGGDFKRRWGIFGGLEGLPKVEFIPSCIKPTTEDVEEVFQHFLTGKAIKNRISAPTWSPLVPPKDYTLTINTVNTYGAKGLGELVWDVVQHADFKYRIVQTRDYAGHFFLIPRSLANSLPVGWEQFTQGKVQTHTHDSGTIYSVDSARDVRTFAQCKRLLLETVLPFWRIGDVKPDSYQQWQSSLVKKTRTQWAGRVEYGNMQQCPVKALR